MMTTGSPTILQSFWAQLFTSLKADLLTEDLLEDIIFKPYIMIVLAFFIRNTMYLCLNEDLPSMK